MEKSRQSNVKLVVPDSDMEREFEITHAERLLGMPNNGGWQLPENSEYIFDLNDGLKRKQPKGNTESAKK